tara:strand:- start:1515 stop:2165 length:651 start_codon:yes stop_codon:yes gene_type:complete
MKRNIKVVMLPTEDIPTANSIMYWKGDTSGKRPRYLGIKKYYDGYNKYKFLKHQYLYATVSQEVEPIKVGDWCTYVDFTNDIRIEQIIHLDKSSILIHEYRKIIATDDPKLKKDRKAPRLTEELAIPQVQQSFLKEFVANPDGEWEVKYESCYNKLHIVLNQDNTVNITSVEEKMYSREQVVKLVEDAFSEGRYLDKEGWVEVDEREFNDWIRENL